MDSPFAGAAASPTMANSADAHAWPQNYAFAATFALVALGTRALLQPWLGSMQPYASGYAAIAAAVWFFGWRPGLLAAVICYLGGTFLFVGPSGLGVLTTPQGLAAVTVFSFSAGLIITIGHRARLAERKLAEANELLRETDRKKDQFLATLSHELRNPVGVISSAVATLETSEQPDARARATIAILARQAAQIRRLIDDLLDVGRITRGRLALHPERVDVRTCVEHAAEASRDALARKRQTLVTSLPEQPVDLRVDHARIVQVVSNLIDNASKYSPEQADIRITLVDGSEVTIDVTDNGPGIDEQVLPHVFDLFDQGGASASGGLGLGLGLCNTGIVEMHGGTIAAGRNPLGEGTSFLVTLPKTPLHC